MSRQPQTPRRGVRVARGEPPQKSVASLPQRRIATGIFVGLFAVYLFNLQYHSSVDNVATAFLPFSIAREGNVDLDEVRELLGPGEETGYLCARGSHVYSCNTVVTPLLVAPLYLLPAHWLAAHDVPYDDVRAQLLVVIMERICAAGLVALSASLLWLVLRRVTTERRALLITVVYGLGSCTWAISSQGLWTHTLSELLLVVLSAVFLAPTPSAAGLALAGASAALAAANRPQMTIFALLALIFVWQHHRRRLLAFAVIPVVGAALLLFYNLTVLRSVRGGYGVPMFSNPLLTGVAGLLVSPNRGLLPFTPIMAFALWGAICVWRTAAPPWLRYLTIGIVLHVLLYAKFDHWWGGWAFGPRYMTDVLPALCLLLPFGLWPLCDQRPVACLAMLLAVYGIVVQAVGVYGDQDAWNRGPIPLNDRVWDWWDLQIVRGARAGWHGGELGPLLLQAVRGEAPARLVQLTQDDLASTMRLLNPPAPLRPGSPWVAKIEVVNRGTRAWPAFRAEMRIRYRVFLVALWFANGRIVPGVGDKVGVPVNVAPHTSLSLDMPLLVPGTPGSYEAEFSIVQALDGTHGVAGADSYRIPIRVQ